MEKWELFYTPHIYSAVKEWYKCNKGEIINSYEIDELPVIEVLSIYLEWEGIIGYTNQIERFMLIYHLKENKEI